MKRLPLLFCLFVHHLAFTQARFVSVDSTKIWVNTVGLADLAEGQPVIVFESGLGTPMGNWERVVEGLAKEVPVVTYDRPGIGKSEAVEEEPTMENVANRLVRLLQTLEVEPPYVLVGHSLGGLYVRGFAIYYPELLAGLVIVDPADFTETRTNRREYYEFLDWEEKKVDSLINVFIEKRASGRTKAPAPIRREGEYLEAIRDQEFAPIIAHELPNIPVHMVIGGRFDMPAKYRSTEYDDELLFRSKLKCRMGRWLDVVQSVDKGILLYSGDAGHFVQWDDPGLVVSSIKLVIQDYWLLQED